MTRHDMLVQPAAPPRWPTRWFAPRAAETIITHASLINIVAAGARSQPFRRLSGRVTAPRAAANATRSAMPKEKTP